MTLRLFEIEGSAALAAVMVTAEEAGTDIGALYFPLREIVPTVELPPMMPLTLQITEVFELPVTVAVYCEVVPGVTLVGPLSLSFTLGARGAERATVRLWET